MPSTTSSLLREAREALLTDPVRAAILLEKVAESLRTAPAPVERSDLAALATLARNGEEFWRAWGRLLGLEPGYTSQGVLAAEPQASHIAVEG